ncbi:MAG: ornithine carbamoyltransferase [Candidatus Peregrinibacteria bacterium]
MNHFLRITDLTGDELLHLIERAEYFRKRREIGEPYEPILTGKNIAVFFEKPSLRTKVSFSCAANMLGGNTIIIDGREVSGTRETLSDVVHNLDRFCDAIFARVFLHSELEKMKELSSVPVINALSDLAHPMQTLADLQTIRWHFGEDFQKKRVAFVGDGCNVPTSLAEGCALLGMHFTIATPPGYEIPKKEWQEIVDLAEKNGGDIARTSIPDEAVEGADVVVTDTWVSMGLEAERTERFIDFAGFGVTPELFAKANAGAIFMHCLPAYRDVEVSRAVIDGPQSKIFDEAECRMHTSTAILEYFFGNKD